jgi:hypothetical protein
MKIARSIGRLRIDDPGHALEKVRAALVSEEKPRQGKEPVTDFTLRTRHLFRYKGADPGLGSARDLHFCATLPCSVTSP